jgi:hypothetical protein
MRPTLSRHASVGGEGFVRVEVKLRLHAEQLSEKFLLRQISG